MTENNKPKMKLRSGNSTVTVWEQKGTGKDGKEYQFDKYQVENNYTVKKEDGTTEWKNNNTFDKKGLVDLHLTIGKILQTLVKEQ